MELPCDLTPEQRELYDQAVEEWRILRLAVNQVSFCHDGRRAFWPDNTALLALSVVCRHLLISLQRHPIAWEP